MTGRYYTTNGDDGTTEQLGGGQVKKYHPRIEAVGTVDEAQAALGISRVWMIDRAAAEVVATTQHDLVHMMAELGASKEIARQYRKIRGERVAWLSAQTESFGARIPEPTGVVIGGMSRSGAMLDMARTIVRRAERHVVKLFDEGHIDNADLLRYLNRLSSLCFVLARHEDAQSRTYSGPSHL